MTTGDEKVDRLLAEVGKNIRALRKKRSLSVRRASDRADGINHRHWQKIEAGKVNITLNTLVRLAKALKVDPYDLCAPPDAEVDRATTQSKPGKNLEQSTTATNDSATSVIKHTELIDGNVYIMPPTEPNVAHVHAVLVAILVRSFVTGEGGPGGWEILSRPELRFARSLHVDQDILIPEIAGWRLERMPKLANGTYLTITPDWVCEVMSLSTARIDRVEKLRIYAREGVQYVWLVDPTIHVLELFTLSEARHWMLAASYVDADRARPAPFDAIELDLSKLWVK